MPLLSHCLFLLSVFCVPTSSCAGPCLPLVSCGHHVGKPKNTLPIFFSSKSLRLWFISQTTDRRGGFKRNVQHSRARLVFSVSPFPSLSPCLCLSIIHHHALFSLHCDFPSKSCKDKNKERHFPPSPQAPRKGLLLHTGQVDIPPAPSAQWLSLHPPLLLSWLSLFCQTPERRKWAIYFFSLFLFQVERTLEHLG